MTLSHTQSLSKMFIACYNSCCCLCVNKLNLKQWTTCVSANTAVELMCQWIIRLNSPACVFVSCSQRKMTMSSEPSLPAANCSVPYWRGRRCSKEMCPERRTPWVVTTLYCSNSTHTTVERFSLKSSVYTLLEQMYNGCTADPVKFVWLYPMLSWSLYLCQDVTVLRRNTASSWDTATTAVWRLCSNSSTMIITASEWVHWWRHKSHKCHISPVLPLVLAIICSIIVSVIRAAGT